MHVFFDDREFNPFIGGGQVNTSIDELNGDVIDRSKLGFIGGAYINVLEPAARRRSSRSRCRTGTPRWGGEWKKAVAHNYRRSIGDQHPRTRA